MLSKTGIMLFTRRRRITNNWPPVLYGKPLTLMGEVKYVGVILESKLTWNHHVKNVTGGNILVRNRRDWKILHFYLEKEKGKKVVTSRNICYQAVRLIKMKMLN